MLPEPRSILASPAASVPLAALGMRSLVPILSAFASTLGFALAIISHFPAEPSSLFAIEANVSPLVTTCVCSPVVLVASLLLLATTGLLAVSDDEPVAGVLLLPAALPVVAPPFDAPGIVPEAPVEVPAASWLPDKPEPDEVEPDAGNPFLPFAPPLQAVEPAGAVAPLPMVVFGVVGVVDGGKTVDPVPVVAPVFTPPVVVPTPAPAFALLCASCSRFDMPVGAPVGFVEPGVVPVPSPFALAPEGGSVDGFDESLSELVPLSLWSSFA